MKDLRINYILDTLNPPPGTKLWYGGATLLGSLRGLFAEEAAWKPAPDRHSIWELYLHVAYWKYAVRRTITGEATGGFPRGPANWPIPDPPTEQQWKKDKKLVKDQQEELVSAIQGLDDRKLDHKISREARWTYADLLMGILTHDMYHTGQIVLMKRLYRSLKG